MLDCAQIRAVENIYHTDSGYALMQYAADSIYQKIRELRLANDRQVVVFVGSGNNGGDGYEIAAAMLKDGFSDVSVIRVVPQKAGIDAVHARDNYLGCGGHETDFDNQELVDGMIRDNAVIVDSMLGIGITAVGSSQNSQKISNAVRLINRLKSERKLLVLSVDIPSLLNADNGMPVGGEAVKADYTYTVFTFKTGTITGRARDFCGKVFAVGNTLPDFESNIVAARRSGTEKHLVAYDDIRPWLPLRSKCAHKGNSGRVLLVGGSSGMTGALILSSLAALRTGAGLITALALSGEHQAFNSVNPCIMTAGTDSLDEKIKTTGALLVGPGMGRNQNAENVFKKCIMSSSSMVIDADGLYHLHNLGSCEFNTVPVLTPHVGEAALLCDTDASAIESDSVGFALMIAEKYKAVCVLKSAATVIASPDGKVYLTATGCSGMASGGMGDLLSGIITSLLGQGLEPVIAAVAGVLIHGEAGRAEAQEGGNIGMCATDLLPHIRLLVNGIAPKK